jgi:sulfur-oxidizing protein SoxZ
MAAPAPPAASSPPPPSGTASPVRALVALPAELRRGVPAELRATLGHPMETGYRRDGDGRMVPRRLVTRFEARLDGVLVFAADLYPAIAANPYLSFWLQVDGPATLTLDWFGDGGFAHRETRALNPA